MVLAPTKRENPAPALLLAFGLHKPKDILKLLLDNGADVHALVPAEVIEKGDAETSKIGGISESFEPQRQARDARLRKI